MDLSFDKIPAEVPPISQGGHWSVTIQDRTKHFAKEDATKNAKGWPAIFEMLHCFMICWYCKKTEEGSRLI